jgi:chaperone BCS1
MFSSPESKMVMAKTAISTVGSIAAAAMVTRSVIRDYLPHEIQDYFYLGTRNFFSRFSNQLTIVVDEFDGYVANEIYEAATLYLSAKISANVRRLKVNKPQKEKNITATMERNEEVFDEYKGVNYKWIWVCEKVNHDRYDRNPGGGSDVRSFQLKFHKKHQETALKIYLPYILEEAMSKKHKDKTVKIHTISNHTVYSSHGVSNPWISVRLDHPATFETVAMDSSTKEMVMNDLANFVKRREKYRKVGKAWKRGYLLYGPPGTGKSSLIAAMANYLNFDIYDLELTAIRHNSDLRRLLVGTANRSILVVEDIDCAVELHDRPVSAPAISPMNMGNHQYENKVTLSGFLNFIDGLWSSCGDERIVVFTTNHKEKLDPALLRPGRMDLHIHMSYCSPCGFKILASNYLNVEEHDLFGEIEDLIKITQVTPAEVAEQLLKSDDPDVTLRSLIDFLHKKEKEFEANKLREQDDISEKLQEESISE